MESIENQQFSFIAIQFQLVYHHPLFNILNAQFNSRSEMLDPHLFQFPRTRLMEIN